MRVEVRVRPVAPVVEPVVEPVIEPVVEPVVTEVLAEPPAASPTPPSPSEPRPRPRRPARTSARAIADPPVVASVSALGSPTEVVGEPATDPAARARPPEESEGERRARLRHAAIGARRAAELSVLSDDPGPVLPSEGAGLAPIASVEILSEAEAEGRHDDHLAARAAERPWIVETAIVLEGPHPDGSYTWQSTSFTATIHADGAVTFSDRGAVEFDLAHGEASFDLGDMIMGAAGADPYAYERERFYEDNVELIEELDAAARVASLRHSGDGIRRRLIRAWEGGGGARARRASLFEEWDLCGETDAERPARDMVLAFIRSELPEGSPEAYPADELAQLNRGRQSREPFAPYASEP
jgi:hypothetical protein